MESFYLILGIIVVLLVMAIVALVSFKRSKDLSSFYVAKRGSRWYLLTGSLFASGVSGATFLGMMAQYYNNGAGTLWINVGIAWSYFVLCFLIGPKLRRFGKITISDYLAERFESPILSPVFSVIVTIWMVVLLGSLYVQGGLLFSNMFGLNYTSSTFIICALVVVFTIFGGMVIVLNTDFIGTIIIIVALIVTIPFLVNAADSWGSVLTTIQSAQPDYFTSSGELTSFTAFSLFFVWLFGYLGNPGYLTRFYTAMNTREIVKAGIAISLIYLPVMLLFFISAFYAKTLFPNIADPETIWIVYTYKYAPPFIVGIAMTGMFVAILSSANSWLLAGSSSLGRDIYQKIINKNASEKQVLKYTKIIILLLAAVSVPLGIWRPTYIIEMMNLAYLIAGSTGGLVILLSMFYRNMTKESAWAGIITGGTVSILWTVLQLADIITDKIDPMIPTLIISFIAIMVVSKMTKPTSKMVSVYDTMSS